ncbi:MAG TPA: ATP-binding protein [Pyrinomonadaceae bacterium]|nr:ATP-binding protein [Pyrinomonadaceae bacterium]
MSTRLVVALAFSSLLLLAAAALFWLRPEAAWLVLAAGLLGALAGRLFPARRGGAGEDGEAGEPGARFAAEGREAPPAAAGEVPAGALLEATMESMREGVLVVDGSWRVVASNDSARSLFGNNAALASGPCRLTELTRNPAVHAAFAAAIERGERTEVKVETRDGDRSAFDLHVAPLRRPGAGAEAPSRGAVGVFFDITRLEQLERVRQEFLSNVSHELRTPLTAILTFVETLEEGAVDDPRDSRRFLSVIRRNAERMRALISDILELSAIEAGQVRVEPVPVGLAELVNDCFTALGARAAERGVGLVNEVAPGALVHADPRRLEQMLTNLADNAVKFSPEGGTVRVTHERAGGRDRVSVSDEGDGIAPEHLPRLFERFYRVDRARSRAAGGTGLGLAIVKHLARAHGGEATVRPAPGGGSIFTVELPAGPDSPERRESG